MSQWVPKTAWRMADMNKRYGLSLQGPRDAPVTSAFRTALPTDAVVGTLSPTAADRLAAMVKARNMFVDVRPDQLRRMRPVPFAVPIHTSDLLSGAAREVLPQRGGPLAVVGASEGECAAAFNALFSQGYTRVTAVRDVPLLELVATLK